MQLSLAIVDFYLFSLMGLLNVNMQTWTLLRISHCRVSVTQVTSKAHGPLVYIFNIFSRTTEQIATNHATNQPLVDMQIKGHTLF